MRGVLPESFSRIAKNVALAGVFSFAVGCSANVTRLEQSFFPEADKNDVTGSLRPVPKVDLGGARTWDSEPMRAAERSRDTAIAAGPVATTPIERRPAPRAGENGFTIVTAEPGETAYTMSRRYGVSVRRIMAANDLARAEDLRPGQDVRIPPVDWVPEKRVSAATPTPPKVPGRRGSVHVVSSGDTLSAIGRRHGMTASQIARHNGMESADRLRVGQRIKIPAEADVRVASASPDAGISGASRVPVPARRPAPAVSRAKQPEPAPRRGTEPDRGERQVAAINPKPETPRSGPLPQPEAMSADKFRWPVRGRVISAFGSKPNGAQNDGINVSVPEGTSVKAAENGVVAYVGNELKGYGNLVLVRHADNWVTAYAHNSQTLVRRGDKVTRGQIIAKAGQTGAVSSPQLHFELRKGSRPVDPLPRMSEN